MSANACVSSSRASWYSNSPSRRHHHAGHYRLQTVAYRLLSGGRGEAQFTASTAHHTHLPRHRQLLVAARYAGRALHLPPFDDGPTSHASLTLLDAPSHTHFPTRLPLLRAHTPATSNRYRPPIYLCCCAAAFPPPAATLPHCCPQHHTNRPHAAHAHRTRTHHTHTHHHHHRALP